MNNASPVFISIVYRIFSAKRAYFSLGNSLWLFPSPEICSFFSKISLSSIDIKIGLALNNFLITIIAAIILMLLVVIGLGVGWILSGKNRLGKRCGMTPKSKGSCSVCGTKKECKSDKSKPDSGEGS